MSESLCSAPHAAMMMMWWTNIDFIQRGEKPGTGTMTSTRGTQHRDGGMWARRLHRRDKVFVSLNRRAINICLLRGSEKWWSCDTFCDMSRSRHKNRQNLVIDLTISVLSVGTSQNWSADLDRCNFWKNILNIRCCVNHTRSSVLNDFYQQHYPSNISGENHNQKCGKIF